MGQGAAVARPTRLSLERLSEVANIIPARPRSQNFNVMDFETFPQFLPSHKPTNDLFLKESF